MVVVFLNAPVLAIGKSAGCVPVMFGRRYPNITWGYNRGDRGGHSGASGAFTSVLTASASFTQTLSVAAENNGFDFSAKQSNSLYSATTVQPSAFQILIIIKV